MSVIAALSTALGLLAIPPVGAADEGSGSDYQIVSGTPAPDGAYPWMAAFLQDGGQVCGASVIAASWILTAAHCVVDNRGQPSAQPGAVSFVVNSTNWTQPGQTLTAAQIIPHPNYDPTTTNNDVALIRVNEAAQVTPVRLAGAGDAALEAPPSTPRVIGYGTIRSDGPASETLLQVDIDVVDNATCANSYPQLNGVTMLCAGNPSTDSNNPGRDSCQGDSGGPLFAEADGGQVQIGVVSFGGECGVNDPGVYARVSTFLDWIQMTTGGIGGDAPPVEEPVDPQPDPGPGGQTPT
ncbi:MAG TPA: serine protease, partial [Euzebya sp.]|nr:serine protease [Euzebya sp.]